MTVEPKIRVVLATLAVVRSPSSPTDEIITALIIIGMAVGLLAGRKWMSSRIFSTNQRVWDRLLPGTMGRFHGRYGRGIATANIWSVAALLGVFGLVVLGIGIYHAVN